LEQPILPAIRKIILKPELAVIMHVPTIMAYRAMKVPRRVTILTSLRASTTLTARDAKVSTARSKGKVIMGWLVRNQALRWWFGLRSHKRAKHFGELSQLLLDRHIGRFLLGDVVMASFEGVYEVGETSTISHEGRKVFWEGRDKAEVMDKKEWLWIPLVEAVLDCTEYKGGLLERPNLSK